ncbi:CBO0543 family protein [Pelotomaculum propionicicum]|uniref:CBO0543 family protein n=1 Tax=Pelotomaculum propionicicum TaxID=258475 RepID=UPI003B7613DF
MTNHEIYTTSIFAVLLNLLTDLYLDVKYDWYSYFEKGVQWVYIPLIFGIFPALSIIFLSYYPFSRKIRYKVYYILAWTLFGVIYEWASIKTGMLYYNGWGFWYSGIAYPIIFIILVYNLQIIRRFKG